MVKRISEYTSLLNDHCITSVILRKRSITSNITSKDLRRAMEFAELVPICIVSALDLVAILVNSMFISIILRKTPPDLSNYGVIMLNIACADLFNVCCNFMCIVRIQNIAGCIVLTFLGPCTQLNARFCHACFAGIAAAVFQSIMLLLLSFAYRYWSLKPKIQKLEATYRGLWIALALSSIPSLVILITWFLAGTYPDLEVTANYTFSAFDLSGGMQDNLFQRIAIVPTIIAIAVCSCIIFVIRRRLFVGIQKLRTTDRHSHQMIYRSLIAQMLLPLVYILGISLWFLDFIGLVHSQTLQRCISTVSSIFAIGSPLINMYHIPAYRKYLKTLFSSDGQIVQANSTIVFSTPDHSRF